MTYVSRFCCLMPKRPPSTDIKDVPPHNMHYPFDDEVRIPRGCLMRKDFPVVALNLTLYLRRADDASGDLAISLADLAYRLAHSTIEVYARGNMFAGTVAYQRYNLLPFLQSNAEEIVREQRIDIGDMNIMDIDLLL